MAEISRIIAQPFGEADRTILDNFTDEELTEIGKLSSALDRILKAAKDRQQKSISSNYR
jgi:hypothetical protein